MHPQSFWIKYRFNIIDFYADKENVRRYEEWLANGKKFAEPPAWYTELHKGGNLQRQEVK